MKYCIIFFLLLSLVFTSCDGRDRALESNDERVIKSNLSLTNIELIKHIPEKPIKSVTDTLIDSKINVKVTYYSSPTKTIEVLNRNKNNQKTKTFYREFESKIEVIKNNKLLFSEVLNKESFINKNSGFWKKAIMQYVWLDDFESTENNYKLYCSFLEPESKHYKMYSINFDNSGNKTIQLIETT